MKYSTISVSPERRGGKPVRMQVIIRIGSLSFTRHIHLDYDGVYRGWDLNDHLPQAKRALMEFEPKPYRRGATEDAPEVVESSALEPTSVSIAA